VEQGGMGERGVKAGNEVRGGDGPLVTDFGLARRLVSGGAGSLSGAVIGTPRYMAPEQASGRKDLTTAVDVYGLGAVLYECLTGRPPFEGENTYEILRQVVQDAPVPPRRLNPRVDADLDLVCLKCLEKEPSCRYPSAEALAEELESWLAGGPVGVRPPTPLERLGRWCRRNRAVAGLLAALLLSLTVGTIVSVLLAHHANRKAEEAEGNLEQARDNEARADNNRKQAETNETHANEARARAQERERLAEGRFYASQINLAQRDWEAGLV